MAEWASKSAQERAIWVVLGAALLGGAGYAVFRPGPALAPAAPETVIEAPDAKAESEPTAQATVAPTAEPELVAEPAAEVAALNDAAAEVPDTGDDVTQEANPPAAATIAAPEATADVTVTTVEPAAPSSLAFDIVRIEPDGSALVAGQAAPNAVVELRLNEATVATATADASGKFVAMFTLAPNDAPGLLSMAMTDADGVEVAAEATVAVAPIAAPVEMAAVDPEPAPVEVAAVDPEPAPVAVADPRPEVAAVDPTAEVAETPMVEPSARNEPELAAVAEDPAAPAALLVTDEGVTVLQGEATDMGANVTIAAIAYTPDGDVQLSGLGAPGQTLRFYLNNALVAELTPNAAQWSLTLPETVPGLYTLRVDQLDTAGKVASRFETPFKRETREALAAVATPDATLSTSDGTVAVTEAPSIASGQPALVAETAPSTDVASAADATPKADAAPLAKVAVESAAEVSAPVAEVAAEPEPKIVATATPAEESAAVAVAKAPPAPVTVTVQPGFTLWGIAKENFGNGVLYVQVFDANRDKIRDPDLIYPGQVFMIPKAAP